MKSFLDIMAEDLLRRYRDDLSKVAVVFPGKRAGIFLNKALAATHGGPVWAPEYTTMGGLFGRLSTLVPADPIDSITMLYSIFKDELLKEGGDVMTLDKFWSWGEVLLSDFDDVDKHLADAKAVFANVSDLQELESWDFLTDEQRETLRHFFGNFRKEEQSKAQGKFLNTWRHLYPMYQTLKERQRAKGILYEGALYRSVIEEIAKDDSKFQELADQYDAVVFAGFNVLNDVERRLMKAFQKTGKALFYWDYDSYYVDDPKHEAGTFMRENLRDFPSAVDKKYFDNLRKLQDVTFVVCSSDNAAARYTHTWLEDNPSDESESRAVVLCNESLLQPVLHALPQDYGTVNVTMGFPLTDTPIYSFITALVNLQIDGYDDSSNKFRESFRQTVLKHPYASRLEEKDWARYCNKESVDLLDYLLSVTKSIALQYVKAASDDIYHQLYTEAVFQTDRILTKFKQQIGDSQNPLSVNAYTLRKLIRETLAQTSIPFHGEPARGLQVMGVLETRCLDFSRMLMLSVEENMLPRPTDANTMIPAALREHFGLTTPRHRICVFSYYFYRLIQRTQHLTCVYNNCTNQESHEMSRFLRQLLAETDIPIHTRWLKSDPTILSPEQSYVEKDLELREELHNTYDTNGKNKDEVKQLSPTAINTWITCPMKFYLTYVKHLRKEKDPQDGMDPSIIGNVFHDTAWLIYQRLTGGDGEVKEADIESLLKDFDNTVGWLLDIAFDINFFHPVSEDKDKKALEMMSKGTRPGNEYRGTHIIERKVMMEYLSYMLQADKRNAPFRITGLERDTALSLDITTEDGPVTVETGGRIDRLDITNDHIRIVDYKTGTTEPQNLKALEDLITGSKGHKNYYFQVFLYALSVMRKCSSTEYSHLPVKPVLFYPAKAHDEKYTPDIKLGKDTIDDFSIIAKDFEDVLKEVIGDIFSSDKPFVQTDDTAACQWCDFRALCGR